jgi:hypothetical protein
LEINEDNIEIRKRLLNLPKLKASENFQINLQNRIKKIALEEERAESARKRKSDIGIFQKFFGVKRKPWLVPAFGLAVVAVLTFSIIFVINKDNPVTKLPDVTVTKESAPVPQEPAKINTNTETLKKEESSGKEIAEDFSSNKSSPKLYEQKHSDQGSNIKIKTETEKPTVKISDVNGLTPPPSESESRPVEKNEDVGKSKISEQPKTEKKAADFESKNGDEKVGRGEVSKKDENKVSKENNQEAKSNKVANDIDKKVLQSLKDKIEKGSLK